MEEIKNVKEKTEELKKEDQQVEQKLDVEKILSIPQRQEVATRIDAALGGLGLNFYEVLLGVCDFSTTILTLELSKVLGTPENRTASTERVNHLREQFVDILNKRESKYLAEEMVAVISILVESTIIGLQREKMAQEEEAKTE